MKQPHKPTKGPPLYLQNPPYFTSVLQNNREISSLLLTSKSGFFQPTKSNDYPSIISNKMRLENLINFQTSRAPIIKEKLSQDRNKKLATLTFRQDISHILDKNPTAMKTNRDFFKERNFSLPFEKFYGMETPRAIDKEAINMNLRKPNEKKTEEKIENIEKNQAKNIENSQEKAAYKKNLDKIYDPNISHTPISDRTPLQIRLQTPNYLKNQAESSSFLAQKLDLNLKKEFPPNQFSNPSSRVEVILLLEWLENSIKDLSYQECKLEAKEVGEKLWWVFEVSYKELERQLIIECNERGKILRKLWDILSELLIKDKENFEFDKKNIEDAAYDEYNRLHKMYKGQMVLLSENIEKLQKEVKLLTMKNIETMKEKAGSEQREHHFTQKLNENSRILNLYKKKLKIVSLENEKLLYKLENSHSPIEKLRESHQEKSENPFEKLQLKIEKKENNGNEKTDKFEKNKKFEKNEKFETNEKLENFQKKHEKNDNSDKSSEKSSEASEKAIEEEFEESYGNLNLVAVTSIPEKSRAELYREKSTEMDPDFRHLYQQEVVTQTELTFLSDIYEKVLINNKACMEMAEDFYYKKELEEEELMKYLSEDSRKFERKTSNKEEIELIKLKLKEFKEKHKKDENFDFMEKNPENVSIVEKIKGALNKVRALKNMEEGQLIRKDNEDEEIDTLMKKDKDYETEEEESENEARDDEGRQENIIRELNQENSEENTDRDNRKEEYEEKQRNIQENIENMENIEKKLEKNGEKTEKEENIEKSHEKNEILIENNQKTNKNLEKTEGNFEESQENFEDSDNLPNSPENQEKSPDNSEHHVKFSANPLKPIHMKSNSSVRFKNLKIETKSPNDSPNFQLRSPSTGSQKQQPIEISLHKESKDSNKTSNEKSRSPSPSINKNTPLLRKNNRNSVFQINLRHSMEPLVKQRSRKSSIFQGNSIQFSNKSRESTMKNSKDQRDLIFEEIEKALTQGISEFPQDLDEYNEVFKDFMSKNKEVPKEKEGYLKLLVRYKTENKKACLIEEKYKRTNELLEMETIHRTKLTEKHQDLQNNYTILQQELERYKIREREFLENQEKEMKASKIISVSSSMELSIKPHEKPKEVTRKMVKQGTVKRKPGGPKETIGISPKLGQKVNIENKNFNSGVQLLEKIKLRKMKKFENFMHIKLVLKQINLIYSEKISNSKENELSKQLAFANSVYNYFLGLFGLKKIADRRFIIFVLSLKKYNSYFRISMFSKLFGLYEDKTNYSVEEFNKYIEAMDFCLNVSTMGVPIVNPEGDSKFYIPYIRALQYTGLFADTRMTPEENQHLKSEVENLKELDLKGINKAGIIDFDLFMERMLSRYRHLVNKAKTYVINAFAACDLDGNKMCNLEEFLLLNRHIEREKYNKKSLKKIFIENADLDNDGEKNLSFDKFSVLCVEYNLFSDESQNKYLQISKKSQLESKMEELKIIWYGKKYQLIESFDNLTIISKEEKENWQKIIIVLEERIMGNNDENEQIKPTLIAYNILVQENELLRQKQEKKDKGIEEEEEEESEEGEAENVLKNVEEVIVEGKKIEEIGEDIGTDEGET